MGFFYCFFVDRSSEQEGVGKLEDRARNNLDDVQGFFWHVFFWKPQKVSPEPISTYFS